MRGKKRQFASSNILVLSVLPACASQQVKLSQLNLPQPLCSHRNPHQRLPSSKHIKGQTSVSWLGKGKGFSLCVCASVCLFHSKLRKKILLYRTKQNCLAVLLGFSLHTSVCYLWNFLTSHMTWPSKKCAERLCVTSGCMVAYHVFLL